MNDKPKQGPGRRATPAAGASGRAAGGSTGRPATGKSAGTAGRSAGTADKKPGQSSWSKSPDRAARPERAERPARPTGAGSADRGPRPDRASARTPSPSDRPYNAGRAGDVKRREQRGLEPLPGVQADQLDPAVRRELRSLTVENADLVARHLVSTGQLIDEEPERALAHARAARATAGRIAVVREAAGLAAYHAGEWAEAVSELRAVRRMTGTQEHVAVLADCERALGRPERAIAEARVVDPGALRPETAVELMIVVSGARRDLGEGGAAVVALQGPELDASEVAPWTVRLWYAYAEALIAAGRPAEARSWFEAVAAIDDEGDTDAEERLAGLA